MNRIAAFFVAVAALVLAVADSMPAGH